MPSRQQMQVVNMWNLRVIEEDLAPTVKTIIGMILMMH